MEPCRKKQRTMSTLTSDWSSLPRDVLMVVAELTLKASVEDFMALGCVCKSWRVVGRDDEFVESVKLSWPRVPFLMLPQKEAQAQREFYSVSRKKIFIKLPIPQAKDCKCIESRFGWLLTIACSPHNEGNVALLNPFSPAAPIPLPNLKTFPSYIHYLNYREQDPRNRENPTFDFITRSVLSANPSQTSHFVLLLVLDIYHMAFWRNGDTTWTKINSDFGGQFISANYSNQDQTFYAVNTLGHICTWDAAGADPTLLKLVYSIDRHIIRLHRWDAYLVESSSGELLLVARNGQCIKSFNKLNYGATEFRVYQLDVTRGECKRVWSLKDDAIFVGHNAAISIKVQQNDAIKSNSIYFSDDSIYAYNIRSPYLDVYYSTDSNSDSDSYSYSYSYSDPDEDSAAARRICKDEWGAGNLDARGGGGKNMGMYNLQDGSIQRFDHPDVETLSYTCPSLWIAPSSFSWRLH